MDESSIVPLELVLGIFGDEASFAMHDAVDKVGTVYLGDILRVVCQYSRSVVFAGYELPAVVNVIGGEGFLHIDGSA